jgi:hypothetical protein
VFFNNETIGVIPPTETNEERQRKDGKMRTLERERGRRRETHHHELAELPPSFRLGAATGSAERGESDAAVPVRTVQTLIYRLWNPRNKKSN